MSNEDPKNIEPTSAHYEHLHLGDFQISRREFSQVEEVIQELHKEEFRELNGKEKGERVNRSLLSLILKAPIPSFVLIPVAHYIERVNNEKILDHYSFANFELWLNQFSQLTREENLHVRALIVGKSIPRDEYQLLFPVGMKKTYPGSHYVTAHSSPDLDTTIASFWGWVDAFGAKVGEGLHLWNVPGGIATAQIELTLLFYEIFGDNVFNHFAKTRSFLSLSSVDLMSQKGLIQKHTDESTLAIDHERNQNAIVLVDERGYYLGDWRNFDVEGVRQVIMLLNHCLRWFENNLHLKLISLFAKEDFSLKDFPEFFTSVFKMTIKECEPAKEFTERQKKYVQDYLAKVLKVPKGLESTFQEFVLSMKTLSIFDFQTFIDLIESLPKSALFNREGYLFENRPLIFHHLEMIIKGLDKAIQSFRVYVERLDVALRIKNQVFGHLPQVVSYRADVEEIRSKMGNYPYLTVTFPDKEGHLIPMGVIHASDLYKPILGTVSLRDFCNREETKIPSYLEIVSVIDHHKSSIATTSPAVVTIADSQSSNALVATLAFQINDRYSMGGMDLNGILSQIEEVKKDLSSSQSKRILGRLLKRLLAAERGGNFYIDPEREFIEYLHFLYGILEDTDVLIKASRRDIECVASLLNRLKSLIIKKETEIVSFDDLAEDENFTQEGSRRLLQNADLYSLYRKVYLSKEEAVDRNLELCIEGKSLSIFVDTKEQNGCCRIGQTKIFSKNVPFFQKHASLIRKIWYEEAVRFYKEVPAVDLHLHMISTIAGVEDLFAGTEGDYTHPDEIWIWSTLTESGIEHLKSFLNSFRSLAQFGSNHPEVEFFGERAKEWEQIFLESFLLIPRKITLSAEGPSLAVLRFKAGTINSRKAMVSPHLPRLGS